MLKLGVESYLAWLVEDAKTYGHDGDYVAVCDFVRWSHEEHGRTCPDLTPYPVGE